MTMKRFVHAHSVRIGDTLCFANPQFNVVVERITQPSAGGPIGFHAMNGKWTSFYQPRNRVRIIPVDGGRAVADDALREDLKRVTQLLERSGYTFTARDKEVVVDDPVHELKNGMAVKSSTKPVYLRSTAQAHRFVAARS